LIGVDPLLEQFLSERDAVCPGCSYNLRGLKSDRCPECGDGLVLSLQLVEPRQFPLIGGLVGLSAGFGLGFLLLIYAALMLALTDAGFEVDEFIWTNLIVCLVHAGAIALWVRFWHPIRRMKARDRWGLVIVCWLLPLISIVIFAKIVQ